MTYTEFMDFLTGYSKQRFTGFELEQVAKIVEVINDAARVTLAFEISRDVYEITKRQPLNLKSFCEFVGVILYRKVESIVYEISEADKIKEAKKIIREQKIKNPPDIEKKEVLWYFLINDYWKRELKNLPQILQDLKWAKMIDIIRPQPKKEY